MEVSLTGNTGYITERFIKAAFPDSHVVVRGVCSIEKSKKNILLFPPLSMEDGKDVLDIYEFDRIIFFSDSLSCHGTQSGELEHLQLILQYCRGRKIQFVYLAGPAAESADKTEKVVSDFSAEGLCQHYINTCKISAIIVHLPFLYSTTYKEDYFYRLFESAEQKKKVVFRESEQQRASFLSMEDLSELLFRIFDSWDTSCGIIRVPEVFSVTYAQLGAEIQKYFPGTKVLYAGEDKAEEIPQDDKVIRYRYKWFPKTSILSDMGQLYENYILHHKDKVRWIDKAGRWLKKQGKLWKAVELIVTFVLAEVLNRFVGNSVQFQCIDVRLLYIVIIGTIYGMNMGVLAAALASLSLAFSYVSKGIDWILLLYEPSNWIPFILYFLVGAICGYIQMRNYNNISFLSRENTLLREKFYYVKDLYQDAVQEKRNLKRQILRSKDSFGKIFDITRKLDAVHPEEIFIRTLRVMEDVLENHSIQIYSISTNQTFARLEAASREIVDTTSHSIKIESYVFAAKTLYAGNIWVNRDLDPNYPMYMVGIKRKEHLVLLVMIQHAEYSQMNLYYQNLLKILCGLVETSLLRAINYQEAIYEERHLNHTIFMKESYFLEKLNFYHSLQEEKIIEYTLIKLHTDEKSLDEVEEILKTRIRENDTVGIYDNHEIYLILHQTSPAQAGIVMKRLEESGLGCEIIPQDDRDEN